METEDSWQIQGITGNLQALQRELSFLLNPEDEEMLSFLYQNPEEDLHLRKENSTVIKMCIAKSEKWHSGQEISADFSL